MQTVIAQELSITKIKAKCDAQCKKILSHKIILAWILKYSVKEFADMDIPEITRCIEGTPELSSAGLLPGSSDHEKISGMSNEDKTLTEGFITYDIRFAVVLPSRQEPLRLLINLEAQNSFYPGYQLVTRGIFYDARMISAQLETEFSIPNYDGIKKVYSIWICMNSPVYIGNAISEYHIAKRDMVSGIPDRPAAYDKLSVVMLVLNENIPTSHKLLHLLNVLFSTRKTYLEKKQILEQEYSILMEYDEKKEWKSMCNYSDYVEKVATERGLKRGIKEGRKQGIKQGMAQGIAQGMAQGMERSKHQIAENLLKAQLLSDDRIAEIVGCTENEIQRIKNHLNHTLTAD